MGKCYAAQFNAYFLTEFKKESDRACVILAGSMLEATLEILILEKLVKGPDKNDPLFDGPNAPISSLSAKIELALRLGIVSINLSRDLHLIRKIRNSFAHDIFECNFKNNTVRNLINELKKSTGIIERNENKRELFDKGPRGDFQMIVSLIFWHLWSGKFVESITRLEAATKESLIYDKDESTKNNPDKPNSV